jgi:hypothetical protein
LNITHFQLFALFGQILYVRKMEKKSKLLIFDPKPISNDQFGSGPGPHTKCLEAPRGTFNTEKCPGKVTFSK